MDHDDRAIRAIAEWLMAEGIVGWTIDHPHPGQPIELRLCWENRSSQERIRRHFGEAVSVAVLPEDAPRIAP